MAVNRRDFLNRFAHTASPALLFHLGPATFAVRTKSANAPVGRRFIVCMEFHPWFQGYLAHSFQESFFLENQQARRETAGY